MALMDEWGFSELVVHPAPLNIFTLFLAPAVIHNSTMKNFSDAFAKFMFWLENSLYILAFVLYELALIPVLYFKMLYHIVKQTKLLNMVLLLITWIPLGPLLLLSCLSQDLFYFMKLLCDFKDEYDELEQKAEDDSKEDKIVLYNEIIDVLKLLKAIYISYQHERRSILAPLDGYKKPKPDEDNGKKRGCKKSKPDEDNDKKRGFKMSKALIIEAWSLCRPKNVSKGLSGKKSRVNIKELQSDMRLVSEHFGLEYLGRLIEGTKVRKY